MKMFVLERINKLKCVFNPNDKIAACNLTATVGL